MTSRNLVLYYSRTGTSRRLAERLADGLEAALVSITCRGYRRGPVGFAQALVNSRLGRLPDLDPLPDLAGLETLVLVSPIWTDTISTPMRALLAGRPALPSRLGIALTSIGPTSHARALPRFQAALPRTSDAKLAVTRRALRTGRAEEEIAAFVRALKDRAPLS
jgi:hypothetical protein